MALKIFEMHRSPPMNNGFSNLRSVPWNAAPQSVAVSGVSAQSNAFAATTRAVTLQPEEDCYVEFGTNPTATTGSFRLTAGQDYDFWVEIGHKLAVIEAA